MMMMPMTIDHDDDNDDDGNDDEHKEGEIDTTQSTIKAVFAPDQ